MYQLGEMAAGIANMAFMCVGIWMAHSFYHTKRPWWACILTWGAAFLFCGTVAPALSANEWFSGLVYERISTLVGFSCIAVYLYLFPEIPVGQRLFTYFFVDNLMYILVTMARYSGVYLLNFFPLPPDRMFLAFYIILVVAMMYLFAVYLKEKMLRLLRRMENQMNGFAVYAGLNYLVLVAYVDPWGSLGPLSVWEFLRTIMICALTLCVYYVAFMAIDAVGDGMEHEKEIRVLEVQLALSGQYYDSLMENINRERLLRHDFLHHLRVLNGMCHENRYEEMSEYLSDLTRRSESLVPVRFCSCYGANVLMNYYAGLTAREEIGFECDAAIPKCSAKDTTALCIVLGNALQNALEACRNLKSHYGEKPVISLLGRVAGDCLTLEIINPFDGTIRVQGGAIGTRKEEPGHGLGLLSISNVVDAHHGFFSTTFHDGIFRIQIVMKMEFI